MGTVGGENSFYVTLQSNACMDVFPGNRISDFKNQLGSSISLPSGQWEVALTDISYTYGNTFFRKGEVLFEREKLENEKSKMMPVACNKNLSTEQELLELLHSHFHESKFAIKANIFSYEISLVEATAVRFSTKLADILGMSKRRLAISNSVVGNGKHTLKGEGNMPVFFNSGNTKLFIYCSLIRPQYVGDVMVPCLRVLNYDGVIRKQKSVEFIHPHYMDLAVSHFDVVHMYIRNEASEPVAFEFGNFTAILRFREKKFS